TDGAKCSATAAAHPNRTRKPLLFRLVLDVRGDAHTHDLVPLVHLAAWGRVALLDFVDVLHALDHATPDRVLAVEERCWRKADEELGIPAVRTGHTRHCKGAAHERFVRELGRQLHAGRAG